MSATTKSPPKVSARHHLAHIFDTWANDPHVTLAASLDGRDEDIELIHAFAGAIAELFERVDAQQAHQEMLLTVFEKTASTMDLMSIRLEEAFGGLNALNQALYSPDSGGTGGDVNVVQIDGALDHYADQMRQARDDYMTSTGDGATEAVMAFVEALDRYTSRQVAFLTERLDELETRLYAPDSGGTGGDINVPRRDVDAVVDDQIAQSYATKTKIGMLDGRLLAQAERITRLEGRVEAGEEAMRRADLAAAGMTEDTEACDDQAHHEREMARERAFAAHAADRADQACEGVGA